MVLSPDLGRPTGRLGTVDGSFRLAVTFYPPVLQPLTH